eukprot:c53484_g1_i1.p1 GENE.c53484_g1_i1~~c53484_g1_i1.p1  ORF type:complete len:274 (+),score=62.95 c53484_g1_i1:40-822(+)
MSRPALFGTSLVLAFLIFVGFSNHHDDPQKYHHAATHLIDEAEDGLHQFGYQNKSWINGTLNEIATMTETLNFEIQKLRTLLDHRDSFKTGWLWFLDTKIQLVVAEKQLAVNDQERLIENLSEDIGVHWRRIKALYGVQSKMFLSEVLVSVATCFFEVFSFWVPSVRFCLFALLMLGPWASLLFYAWFSVGAVVLPVTLGLVGAFWITKFPLLIVQYSPTPLEFVVVYAFGLFVVGLLLYVLSSFIQTKPPRVLPRAHND